MNNRQAGRRRGRGGQQQRPQGGNPGRPDNGNRIDNRARGNAAQLLEKYKNLARDAQMQGDRVNTEYYHQFADHYFRVLSESRSRFEENRRQRGEDDEDDFENEGEFGTPDQAQSDRRYERPNDRQGERQDRGDRQDRPERGDRQDRPERNERQDRPERNDRQERPERGERPDRGERRDRDDSRRARVNTRSNVEAQGGDAPVVESRPEAPVAAEPAEDAPRRRGRPRRQPVAETQDEGSAAIEADRLPPSLGLVSEGEAEEAPKPRRRRRKDEEATSSAA